MTVTVLKKRQKVEEDARDKGLLAPAMDSGLLAKLQPYACFKKMAYVEKKELRFKEEISRAVSLWAHPDMFKARQCRDRDSGSNTAAKEQKSVE